MKDAEIIVNINKLIDYSETQTGVYAFSDKKSCVVQFSSYVEKINQVVSFRISDKHTTLYHETFYAIFNKGNIKERFVIKTVSKKFHAFLFDAKVNGKSITEREYSKFINGMIMAKCESVSIFHKVFGLEVKNDEPVKVGCFTFYNAYQHKEQILKRTGYPSWDAMLESHSEFQNHETWISVDIDAVDNEKAYEIACQHFEVFQGICQFIFDIEGYNAYAVCVLNDIVPTHDRCYMFSETHAYNKGESGFRRSYNIEIQQLIHDTNHLFQHLLNRIFLLDKNVVNNRLRNAFATYGRIIHEHSDAQKFVMYITAIESLVGYDCPNLAELIADFLSGVISKNLEEFNISKEHLKKIYDIRSDVSHGSEINVLSGDLLYAKWYAMDLIRKFVSDREIEHFTNNSDLKTHLESKKIRLSMQRD